MRLSDKSELSGQPFQRSQRSRHLLKIKQSRTSKDTWRSWPNSSKPSRTLIFLKGKFISLYSIKDLYLSPWFKIQCYPSHVMFIDSALSLHYIDWDWLRLIFLHPGKLMATQWKVLINTLSVNKKPSTASYVIRCSQPLTTKKSICLVVVIFWSSWMALTCSRATGQKMKKCLQKMRPTQLLPT